MQVAPRDGKRLKNKDLRKLGKIKKNLRILQNCCIMLTLPPEIKILSALAKAPENKE